MDTIIFLGAGASAAEGAPIQSELFKYYFQQHRGSSNIMNRELATFFDRMFGINVDNDLSSVPFPTFEEAIGILDLAELRGESLKDFSLDTNAINSGRIRHIRQYLVLAMSKAIADGLRETNQYHCQLVGKLSETGHLTEVAFVSTNYDILIDNALADLNPSDPGTFIDYGVRFTNYDTPSDWSQPGVDATHLLKVHGSLNWLHCRTCTTLTLTPQEKGVIRLIAEPGPATCSYCGTLMTPIIIPPTFYKNMSNIFISVVWHKAEQLLKSANHIVFCGYSFPDADMHIKYLLKRAQTIKQDGTINFTVINNHLGKTEEQRNEEKQRYQRFLHSPVNYTTASFQQFASEPVTFLER